MRSRTLIVGALVGIVAFWHPALAQAQSSGQQRTTDVIKKWDPDKDGTLDRAEVKKAATARFRQLDPDKDGTLDRKEAAKAGIGKADFAKADPDKDGTIDQNEYLALVEQRFKAANPDSDGTVGAAELKSPAGQALLALLSGPAPQYSSR